jgi:hypothetical protein
MGSLLVKTQGDTVIANICPYQDLIRRGSIPANLTDADAMG